MILVFLGPPGSGKGTQAKRLADTEGLLHISTGDLFREAITKKTPLGVKIKNFVDSGKLVPDALVSDVIFEKLKALGPKVRVLLDGYPRTIEQAKALDKFAKREQMAVDLVAALEVNRKELIDRLVARRQCPQCKEIYNLLSRPPKVANRCDVCQSELQHRPDDRPEVVEERLRVYDRQTEPILDYYKGRPGFFRINGGQAVEKVFADILSAVRQGSSGKEGRP